MNGSTAWVPARLTLVEAASAIDDFAAAYPWPKGRLPSVSDHVTRRREYRLALGVVPMLERVLTEDRWLILQLRVVRGVLTRCLAALLWNAAVVAVPAEPYQSNGRQILEGCAYRHGGSNAFFDDCWRYRRRIIPCPLPPSEAVARLRNSGLSPHVVVTLANRGREVSSDLAWAAEQVPDALVVGCGWTMAAVRDAVADLACQGVFELDVVQDAWCVWKERERWLPM